MATSRRMCTNSRPASKGDFQLNITLILTPWNENDYNHMHGPAVQGLDLHDLQLFGGQQARIV